MGGVDFPSSISETRKLQSFCVVAKKQNTILTLFCNETHAIINRSQQKKWMLRSKPTKKVGCFGRSPRNFHCASQRRAPDQRRGCKPQAPADVTSGAMPRLGIGIRERRFLSIPVALRTAFIGPVGSSLHSAPLSTSILDLELYDTLDGSNAVGF